MRADRNKPFQTSNGPVGTLQFRCGKCIGCRIDRARDWSLRCRDEAAMHDQSFFLTLTYDEKNVPVTLVPEDLSGFVKRLRSRIGPLRFFGCGEYGDRFGRPHYHALVFGNSVDLARKVGKDVYESKEIGGAWDCGKHVVGAVTPASAAYVAGYCAKKFGVFPRDYAVWDADAEELVEWQRPFSRMSNRPGIGVPYLERYGMELLRGYAVRDGRKVPLPRFYREWLKERHPDRMHELDANQARLASSDFAWDESDPQRLQARQRYTELTRAFFKPE